MAGHDVADDPDAVRATIGVTGQFFAADNLLTGAENLRLMADLHHPDRSRPTAGPGLDDVVVALLEAQPSNTSAAWGRLRELVEEAQQRGG